MQKQKNYDGIKFPYEVITAAHSEFKKHLGTKSKKPNYVIFSATYSDGTELEYDKLSQWQSDYATKSGLRSANIQYSYPNGTFGITLRHGYYNESEISTVKVALNSPEAIDKTFAPLEDYYSKQVSKLSLEHDKQAPLETRYDETIRPPSAFLDKASLLRIQEYILQRASPYRSQTASLHELYQVHIRDSTGSMSLDSIEIYPHDLFDNGTESIIMSYGYMKGPLSISLHLAKTGDKSELKITYYGETAKEVVRLLKTGICDQFKDFRTWAWVYHPSFGVFIVLIIIFLLTTSILLALFTTNHYRDIQIIGSTTLLLATYMFIAPNLIPYIMFDTRQNQSTRDWSRSIVQFILGLILAWLLYAIFGLRAP